MKKQLLSYILVLFSFGAATVNHAIGSCGTPNALYSGNISFNSVMLEWTPVPGAMNYQVQYQKAGTATWQFVTTGTNSCTVSGLTPNTLYEWQVEVNCQSGPSALSEFNKFTTLNQPVVSPGGIYIHSITNTSVLFSWVAAPGTCGYNLQWRPGTSGAWTTITGISSTYFNLTGLTACMGYQFRVRTSCSNGSSAYTAVSSFTTVGCQNNSTVTTSSRISNRDKENENILQVTLYPNPVRDHLTIEYNSPNNAMITESIYNIIGKNLMSTKNAVTEGRNFLNLDTSELPEGIYFYEIENNGELLRSKFMISK